MHNQGNKIELMRPKLPVCESFIPYLQEIDSNRWYSNFGPLSLRLASKMAKFFQKQEGCAVTLNNGTDGLTNILRALNIPRGSYCLLPAWTFIATPASVIAAGAVPYFLDVNENTWALDPETILGKLHELGNKVGAIMVVAPFGAPLDLESWDKLSEETGIPIIIDAAAGFDSFSTLESSIPRKNPVMISLHATKTLGIGEGGIVISSDKNIIDNVRKMSNFGFCGSRIVSIPGTNGKMSEYQAAIGLAALDNWKEKREEFNQLKAHYLHAIKSAGLNVHAPSLEGEWVASTLTLRLPEQNSDIVIRELNKAGIESRKWWGDGCHVHPAYMPYPKSNLEITEMLCNSTLALPFWIGMTKEQVKYVVDTLSDILASVSAVKERAYA